jgi:hypothetical protein
MNRSSDAADACIVEGIVQAPKLVLGGSHHGSHMVRLGDVAANSQALCICACTPGGESSNDIGSCSAAIL